MDLLRRFGSGVVGDQSEITEGDSDDIELSLGLSIGGDERKQPKNMLLRTSSANFPAVPVMGLARTSSLPVETEEERKRRKEAEGLRRFEAKRKRLERRNSMKSKGEEEGLKSSVSSKFSVNSTNFGVNGVGGFREWLVGCKRARVGDGGRHRRIGSQGSVGSQGSSSSNGAEFDCPGELGSASSICNGSTEAKIPSTASHPVSDHISKNPPKPTTIYRDKVNPSKKGVQKLDNTKNAEKNMMEDMPCVVTKGVGPNGRRVEGFLYKYRKGEGVSIVCLCHGSFLTPAEFVKHAGGDDVENPLKHIVVNPSPSAL